MWYQPNSMSSKLTVNNDYNKSRDVYCIDWLNRQKTTMNCSSQCFVAIKDIRNITEEHETT